MPPLSLSFSSPHQQYLPHALSNIKPKIFVHVGKTGSARIRATKVPARDRVIDFGRHKGKMLGSLPSAYLKWVSANLRARDFQEWANLAEQVLNDPVYRDRIEWEFAEKVLNGDVSSTSAVSSFRSGADGAVSQLLEISERFGWDNEDKVGWSKIDFGLLGTSKGGRIPRANSENESEGFKREQRSKKDKTTAVGNGEDRRRERRHRGRMKRGGLRLGPTEKNAAGLGFTRECKKRDENGRVVDEEGDQQVKGERNLERTVEIQNPFPGRESLLKKVLSRSKRL
ncbi:hypothetical protein NMG60_11003925 [Bertholletia excelsa]